MVQVNTQSIIVPPQPQVWELRCEPPCTSGCVPQFSSTATVLEVLVLTSVALYSTDFLSVRPFMRTYDFTVLSARLQSVCTSIVPIFSF